MSIVISTAVNALFVPDTVLLLGCKFQKGKDSASFTHLYLQSS